MTTVSLDSLNVTYPDGTHAVRDVSMSVAEGELVAVVGESGCGKSTLAKTLLGVLPAGSTVTGSVRLGGRDLSGASPGDWRDVRGREVGYVSQDPFAAMDPLWRIGSNVGEAWRVKHASPAPGQVTASLEAVGIEEAAERMRQFPHEWSGGMLQRAEIAAAGAWAPQLLVADEPTAALDADLADAIMERLRTSAASVLLISHDLALVSRHADRVLVMYGGRVVEAGRDVLRVPRHPYTVGLLAAIPRPGHGLPTPLDGFPPDLRDDAPGCPFAPRCTRALPPCHTTTPALAEGLACPVVLA
ncbi:MAG TPA: ABC transporter ATP-binding protein [Propioniciclava sp.]|jgi:peptide/nickel transport system ATP-binding protein|uniref:ABC transporter ATP-binding protein n=1 Tax=Propioniciclava sp. TaxID=2038686 RepID=UPI002B71F484|nr:ABC transporter ATP-binding protein [Propioniciclava sp.]HRL48461.1 ABC transporter ATP-binding protein [Propioniciclava sp.]HRL78942.1 ABC transporter ATP-binding protein [Propioniciclava sp.]